MEGSESRIQTGMEIDVLGSQVCVSEPVDPGNSSQVELEISTSLLEQIAQRHYRAAAQMAAWEPCPAADAGTRGQIPRQTQGPSSNQDEFDVSNGSYHTGYLEGEAWAHPRCDAVLAVAAGQAQGLDGADQADNHSFQLPPPPADLA